MPSLGQIFTSGLIATVLAFTALGVAVADDHSPASSQASEHTAPGR